jgi:transcriptional regulator with XRE-family HTH domain
VNPVRAWRLLRGLSQQELAQKAGLSQSMISRVERDGVAGMRSEHLAALAGALGVACEELLPITFRAECVDPDGATRALPVTWEERPGLFLVRVELPLSCGPSFALHFPSVLAGWRKAQLEDTPPEVIELVIFQLGPEEGP